MDQKELYGNWLCPPASPGRRVVTPTGVYYLSGRPANTSHFRSDSPDSFSNEDYDDVSMSELGDHMQQRLSAHEENADVVSQRNKGGTGVYSLAGKPAFSSLPRTADLIPDSKQGIGYRPKSLVTLYILMGICFAMWAVLLSLAVVKYSEMSEELKVLNYNYSETLMNVLQDLTDAQKERERIHRDMNKSYKELWDITESICSALPESIKCTAGWEKFQKACYYFSNKTKNWKDAMQFCMDEKSHLVSINDDEEQAFLCAHKKTDRTYWLGLSDAIKEGKWQWVDNTSYSTSFWKRGEPANKGDQDCATLNPSGTWSAYMCSMDYYWVCEKNWIC
ncbi:C-type lectin domain family 17, member A-like [Carettochelys insculpta]|uniref:C-type lectin domain family 17, member A-like n=1 Tax=Carettochelys insculpta TaxID=44489 RepID=UPI003EBE8000